MNSTNEQFRVYCAMGLDTFGRPMKNDSEILPSGVRVRREKSVQKDCQGGTEDSNRNLSQTGNRHHENY